MNNMYYEPKKTIFTFVLCALTASALSCNGRSNQSRTRYF